MIIHMDHVVLTVRDIDKSAQFFARVLGMEIVEFGEGRKAVAFGSQKINLQTLGMETLNYAGIGSGDICLITQWSIDEVISHLGAENVMIIEGPIKRSGATGPILSVYFNDLDGNLIEIASYDF
ncbi:MAG: VOC family protein [Rhizobiaceae bacterium]|nr:VOC family protein [Rhizobiaceae bacterium]